ncbi:N-terminal nucleophile aminohydrolase [Dendrothele bispora CBS 962.96]|uniref:Proteasome subunit beta n=1 Tax=Dendrothele bispora (strain CBS 962.96) TaxID=1314807 RepID=A0A4S8LF30_DENBC|nr:N-terminal nucleophile aminohydrolase [Dendrothele bispora CBS 962.96]
MPDMVSLSRGNSQQFNTPYSENGGTILAVAGSKFCVIAGDTRKSNAYNNETRYAPKLFRLTDKAVIAVNGFAADGNMFVNKVKQQLEWYRHGHARDMPLYEIARLLQTMLYARRFFPYYVSTILSGIEEDGTGAVYTFDSVGSYERDTCRVAGAAQSFMQPYMDNQVHYRSQRSAHGSSRPTQLPLSNVLSLVMDSFASATERNAEVGDGIEIYVVLAKGSSVQGLEKVPGAQEMTATGDGERVFVVRRNLRKD